MTTAASTPDPEAERQEKELTAQTLLAPWAWSDMVALQASLEPLSCTSFISAISLKRKLVPNRSLFETSHAVLGAEGSRALVGQPLASCSYQFKS